MASKHPQPELRMVLLGKTGTGKSEAGNIILGKKSFKTDLSSVSVTQKCQLEQREFAKQTLAVVDTPGLFHTSKSVEEVKKEILECTMLVVPGPHVFLLVMKLGAFSRQDKEMLETFQKVFQNAKCHTIVLFTHADKCKTGCEAFIESNAALKKFISESCGAYHVFNKNDKDEPQVSGLVQKVNSMIQKSEKPYYSNDMFKLAAVALEKKMGSKQTRDNKEKAVKVFQELISLGKPLMEVLEPDVAGPVSSFLDKLKEVALKLMPPEATKPK